MQKSTKRILLLGSGYMSESVADYMLRRPEVRNPKNEINGLNFVEPSYHRQR